MTLTDKIGLFRVLFSKRTRGSGQASGKKLIESRRIYSMERQIPKNVRQIGNVSDSPKIYVEDYVDTFFLQLCDKAKDGPIGAFLVGDMQKSEDEEYVYIYGAIQMHDLKLVGNEYVIDDETWKNAYEDCKQYFEDGEMLGWFVAQPGVELDAKSNIVKLHKKSFPKQNTVFVMKDSAEKEESYFVHKLNDLMEIGGRYTYYEKNPCMQNYMIAARRKNGVSPSDVLSTLSGYIGGNYASNMNRFSKLYRVMVQASPEFRLDTEALNNMFVRNSDGEMSPVSQYLTLTRVYGAESLTRFNLFSAISVNGAPADGYSSGQAIQVVREVAEQVLPAGYGFEFGGMSREESSTGNTTTLVFIICVVFIYLILCALYESLFIPIAVILSVPFGLAGSFLFAKMFGLENNIYLQTGLIMLIGLLSKTAILLTEYASERRRQGMTITQAAVSAAQVRLRPILMTSLTMIFGMLPMMFASGVGANGNISIGVGTVGGMLIGTVALLFIVPVLFIVFQYLQEKLMPARKPAELENL